MPFKPQTHINQCIYTCKQLIVTTINRKTQKTNNFHESNVEKHTLNEEREGKNTRQIKTQQNWKFKREPCSR